MIFNKPYINDNVYVCVLWRRQRPAPAAKAQRSAPSQPANSQAANTTFPALTLATQPMPASASYYHASSCSPAAFLHAGGDDASGTAGSEAQRNGQLA